MRGAFILGFLPILQVSNCIPLTQETVSKIAKFAQSAVPVQDGISITKENNEPKLDFLTIRNNPVPVGVPSVVYLYPEATSLAFGNNPLAQVSGSVIDSGGKSVFIHSTTPSGYAGVSQSSSGGTSQSSVSFNPGLQSLKQNFQAQPTFGTLLHQGVTKGIPQIGSSILPFNLASKNNGVAVGSVATAASEQMLTQYSGAASGSLQSNVKVLGNTNTGEVFVAPPSFSSSSIRTPVSTGAASALSAPAQFLNTAGKLVFHNNAFNKGTLASLAAAPTRNQLVLEMSSPFQTSSHDSAGGVTSSGFPVPGNSEVTTDVIQTPTMQAQVAEVPCTLKILSPVPVTVNTGLAQIATSFPIQQQHQVIPTSYIDNSPPTVAILRPPSSLLAANDPENLPIAAPISTSNVNIEPLTSNNFFIDPTKVTTVPLVTAISEGTTQNAVRAEDSRGVYVHNDEPASLEPEESSPSGPARNGLPIVYTMFPSTSHSLPSFVSEATPVLPETITNAKTKSSLTSRPTRGKNPFFNVNKRKHFEFYQYF